MRFPAILIHPDGTASKKAQQLLFLAHFGLSAGQDRSWGRGAWFEDKAKQPTYFRKSWSDINYFV
jgi:hypothetical protein